MIENVLYQKPLPPWYLKSRIYAKSDWNWYYINNDWIEHEIVSLDDLTVILDWYVEITGDTMTWELWIPSIMFDTTPPASNDDIWRLRWNEAEHCPEYVTWLGNVAQLNKEIWEVWVNKTWVTATDWKCVYASWVQGNRLAYNFADASDGNKCAFVWVVTASTLNNEEWPVTAWWMVNNLNTSAWAQWTKLYVSADWSGDLTDVAAPFPNYRIWVAIVVNQHITQGSIFVAPKIDHSNGITFHSLDIITLLTSSTAKFGNTDEWSFSEFEADWTLKMNWEATTWNDINYSASNLRPWVSSPIWSNIVWWLYWYTFSPTILEELHWCEEVLHDYQEWTDISIHIHWAPTTTDTWVVRWGLEYSWINIWDTWTSTTTIYIEQASTWIIWRHQIIPFADIVWTGKKMWSYLCVRIFRDATHINDTYTWEAFLPQFWIHYQRDTLGSRERISK